MSNGQPLKTLWALRALCGLLCFNSQIVCWTDAVVTQQCESMDCFLHVFHKKWFWVWFLIWHDFMKKLMFYSWSCFSLVWVYICSWISFVCHSYQRLKLHRICKQTLSAWWGTPGSGTAKITATLCIRTGSSWINLLMVNNFSEDYSI